MTELLTAVCPAVLVLEDLHWADQQTADFLHYLMADPPPQLSLVVTFRSGEMDPTIWPPTRSFPAGVTRCELTLSPLDAAQTGQLAASIADVDRIPEEFAGHLWSVPAGCRSRSSR